MTSISGVALVTGGGAGLGKACALTLGKRGAKVAVHYMKSREGAEAVVAELKSAGTEAAAFQADLTKSADVARLVDEVVKRFGTIDILVIASRQTADRAAANCARDFAHGFEVAWRGDGKASLDDVHAQIHERLRNLQFFFKVHAAAWRLLAVAQRGVENDDAPCFVRGHGRMSCWSEDAEGRAENQ